MTEKDRPLLQQEDKLIWSPVVANSNMNRERQASGINSYEQEFGFRPEHFILQKIKEQGHASWLDLCCGRGKALIQTAAFLSEEGYADKVFLKGIDLIDQFDPSAGDKGPVFELASVVDWMPDRSYDLITCSHGLHYLGDKLKALGQTLDALAPGGLFVANFDIESLYIDGKKAPAFLKRLLEAYHIRYQPRKRLLTATGPASFQTDLTFTGADDQAGPNYTGQPGVHAYYTSRV